MLSRAQNTFHHNPRLRGPVSSILKKTIIIGFQKILNSLKCDRVASVCKFKSDPLTSLAKGRIMYRLRSSCYRLYCNIASVLVFVSKL